MARNNKTSTLMSVLPENRHIFIQRKYRILYHTQLLIRSKSYIMSYFMRLVPILLDIRWKQGIHRWFKGWLHESWLLQRNAAVPVMVQLQSSWERNLPLRVCWEDWTYPWILGDWWARNLGLICIWWRRRIEEDRNRRANEVLFNLNWVGDSCS